MTQKALVETAYTLFPRNISYLENESEYRQTKEFKSLMHLVEGSNSANVLWLRLLSSISEAGFEIEELGTLEEIKRGFQIRIRCREQYTHLCVSAIAPIFFFYSMENIHLKFGNVVYEFRDVVIPSNQVLLEAVEKCVKSIFEGYTRINPEWFNYPLENIQFSDVGYLGMQNSFSIPMTLYNAFFSTKLFY